MEVQEFTKRVQTAEHKLFRIAYTIVRSEADCADALQEALIKAWRNSGSLRNEKLFDTWLVRILINECYTLLKKRKRSVSLPSSLSVSFTPPENPELHDALMALDDKHRLPVTLYYTEGYSVAEIASILKIPEGTVKGRLYRARKSLKALLTSEVNEL